MHYVPLGKIVQARDSLEKIFDAAPEDIDFAFELANLKRELDDRTDVFQEQQSKYAEKYGTRVPDQNGYLFVQVDEDGEPIKEDGQYVTDSEAIGAFNEKMDALAEKEVEISRKLTRSEIAMIREDVELTSADIRNLLWLIEGEEEEQPDE